MSMYASYYNEARTYLSLGKDSPITRPITRFGRIFANPTVDVHIRHLRKAINATDESDLIRTVRSGSYSLDREA